MPPKSEAQRRFFRWAEEHPSESGVSKSVSKEFNNADPGGELPERKSKSNEDRMKGRYRGKSGEK